MDPVLYLSLHYQWQNDLISQIFDFFLYEMGIWGYNQYQHNTSFKVSRCEPPLHLRTWGVKVYLEAANLMYLSSVNFHSIFGLGTFFRERCLSLEMDISRRNGHKFKVPRGLEIRGKKEEVKKSGIGPLGKALDAAVNL